MSHSDCIPSQERGQERPVTVFSLPMVFRCPETGQDLFVFDSERGRPVLRALDSEGRSWFTVGPLSLIGREIMGHEPGAGAIDAPIACVHNPATGFVGVEMSVDAPDCGSGDGHFTVFRESGRQAAYIGATRRGGNLAVLYGPDQRDEEDCIPGQEAVALEFHQGNDGGVLILSPRGRGPAYTLGYTGGE